jgi:phage terminase small subunit
MPGRPPKSVTLHRLEGTFRHDRHDHRAHEPAAAGSPADAKAPHWMLERQKRRWRQAVAEAPPVLRNIDETLVTAFVLHADVLVEVAKLHNKARLIDAEGNPSVYLRVLRQHTEVLVALGNQLGFSPAARIRLGQPAVQPPTATEPDNPHARFDIIHPDGRREPYGGVGSRKRG